MKTQPRTIDEEGMKMLTWNGVPVVPTGEYRLPNHGELFLELKGDRPVCVLESHPAFHPDSARTIVVPLKTMDEQKVLNLLLPAMSEMRRTAKLLQLVAVGGKIDRTHYCIQGNNDKADEIEAFLREHGHAALIE